MPLYFIVAVPLVVAVVSGLVGDDDFSDGINAIISLIVLVSFAWLWSSVGSAVISADQVANLLAIIAFSLALLTPISPLFFVRQWLMVHTRSPLAALPTITISVAQPALPPTEQRGSGLRQPGQRWTANPPTPAPTTWQPSSSRVRNDQAQGIHYVDTLSSVPVVSQPLTSSSPRQPSITLPPPQPMYPPYSSQKDTMY
jgi:hypothetical protein